MEDLQTPDFNSIGRGLMEDLVTYASVTGVEFFKSSFDNQGFTDEVLEKWVQRKDGDVSRAILVNTTFLRDSTQVTERNVRQIVFANPAPYASAHNEGATITIRVTKKARKYFWYMFRATKNVKWKYMATTKRQRITITIPARPFLKESKTLMKTIDNWATEQLVERFNNAGR